MSPYGSAPEDRGRPGHRRSPEIDDQLLVRYVLGLLPDDKTEFLDEASIADDDVAVRGFSVVEDDLVRRLCPRHARRGDAQSLRILLPVVPERREHVRFASEPDPGGRSRRAPCGQEAAWNNPRQADRPASDAPLRVGEAAGLGNVQASGAASARRGLMAGLAAAAALPAGRERQPPTADRPAQPRARSGAARERGARSAHAGTGTTACQPAGGQRRDREPAGPRPQNPFLDRRPRP